MNWKILSLLGSLALSSIASAEPPHGWFICKSDQDCVDIQYECAGATVNKSFAKEADEYYSRENARSDCVPGNDPKLDRVPFKVFCKAGVCGKQGRNPKKGMS